MGARDGFPHDRRRCNRMMALLLLAALVVVPAGQVHARDGRTEVSVFSGYRLGGDFKDRVNRRTLGLDSAAAYGVAIDIPYEADTQFELLWSHARQGLGRAAALRTKPFVDLDVDYVHIGGVYLPRGRRLRPFVTASLGITHMNPVTRGYGAATRLSFGLGAGVKWWMTRHLGLRLEGRGFMTLLDSGGAIFCGNNGCIASISGTGLGQLEATAGLIFAF